MWDALSLKDLGNLLFSGEFDITDLSLPKPSERSFVVDIFSLLCSCSFSWEIRLEDLKGALRCEGEIPSLPVGGNNSMPPLCISLSFPSSVNISSIVKSTTALWLNNSYVLLLLWEECKDDFCVYRTFFAFVIVSVLVFLLAETRSFFMLVELGCFPKELNLCPKHFALR